MSRVPSSPLQIKPAMLLLLATALAMRPYRADANGFECSDDEWRGYLAIMRLYGERYSQPKDRREPSAAFGLKLEDAITRHGIVTAEQRDRFMTLLFAGAHIAAHESRVAELSAKAVELEKQGRTLRVAVEEAAQRRADAPPPTAEERRSLIQFERECIEGAKDRVERARKDIQVAVERIASIEAMGRSLSQVSPERRQEVAERWRKKVQDAKDVAASLRKPLADAEAALIERADVAAAVNMPGPLSPIAAKELDHLRRTRHIELVAALRECDENARAKRASAAERFPASHGLSPATLRRFKEHAAELNPLIDLFSKNWGEVEK